jgi:2-phosphoglycerate kinase
MEPDEDALAVPVMLAVLDPEDLRARFEGRGRSAPDRRAGRYLDNFDAIWRLQSWLLAEADRCQVPIISSVDRDQTVRQIMGIVIDALSQYCRATPHNVFAAGGRKS